LIGDRFFSGPKLTSIIVAENNPNYSSINGILYDKQQTTLIRYPEGKTGTLTIPNTVTTIGDQAFRNCTKLTSVTIGNSVTSIGNWAFDGCSSLTSITIPNSVTSIGIGAFRFCYDLTSLTIGNSVTSIGEGAFTACFSLTSITIPESVTSIGNSAFFNCTGLTSIINQNPVPQVINDGMYSAVFSATTYSNATLYVPATSLALYQEANGWKNFNIVELPEISENDIAITPSDNSALIEWQNYENAEGYRIIFYGDEAHTDTIRILEFNAQGELIDSIIFRAKSVMHTASETHKYVVSNLLRGTDYYYTLEILGVNSVVLASLSGEFITTDFTTDIVETQCIASLPKVAGYYNILGQKLPKEPESGIYIILYDTGKAEKIIK
jgi:hypothetical protein